jgi:hypothetical protein
MKLKISVLVGLLVAGLGLASYFWIRATQITFERAQKHCACLILLDQNPANCEQWTQISESSVSRPSSKTLIVGNFEFDHSDPQSGCRWLGTQD